MYAPNPIIPKTPLECIEARADISTWFERGDTEYLGIPESFGKTGKRASTTWLSSAKAMVDDATLFWVEPEMGQLVDHASSTLPPNEMPPPLSPSGLMFFAGEVAVADRTAVAVLWDEAAAIWFVSEGERMRCGVPTPHDLRLGNGDFDDTRVRCSAFLRSCWLLMSQRIAVERTAGPSRQVARRLARRGYECSTEARIISLRKDSGTAGRSDSSSSVDWSHRWIVDGHWRNQYLPSKNDHRLTWIALHVKGPEHLPLETRERVYRWHR